MKTIFGLKPKKVQHLKEFVRHSKFFDENKFVKLDYFGLSQYLNNYELFLIKNNNEFLNVNVTTVIYDWFASIRYDYPKSPTDLSVAPTIAHEVIHVYLVAFFANDKTKANLEFADLVVEFAKTQDLNSAHHEEFVRKFSSDISISLEEYGISKGYNLTKQFYDDMSWAGLYKTAAFEKLDNATKERIINVIAHEAIGKDFNGDSVIQNGTKIICNEQTN